MTLIAKFQPGGIVQRMCWPLAFSMSVVLSGGQLFILNLIMPGDISGCQDQGEGRATGIWCLEGRNAVGHPTRHMAAAMGTALFISQCQWPVAEKACSTAMKMHLFSIPKPRTHFPTRVQCWLVLGSLEGFFVLFF